MDTDVLFEPFADAQRATAPIVLTPGPQIDEVGTTHEIGTDRFADEVLGALPPGTLYRWDFLVGELVGPPGERRFQHVGDQRMRAIVDEHVRLMKWHSTKSSESRQMYCACRRDWGGLILAQAAVSSRVPALSMITQYPVYAGDYELVRPGWNPDSGIFYDEPPHLVGLLPTQKPDNAVFEDLTVDFPFADNASRANLCSAVITLVVRPALASVVPIFVFTASLERTGKGKVIESIVGRACLGRSVPVMQLGSREEEREKRITSLIVEGTTVVHLDNLATDDVLDSPALASLATARTWKGRLLGSTRTPRLPNHLVVLMSGNNVRATGEITKRTVPIILQPHDDHPEDRADFEHPQIEAYAAGRQRELLAEVLGMVEAWKASGRPMSTQRMGGFEGWTGPVGGILESAGVTGWMGNYRNWVRRGDEFAADAEVLIESWEKRHYTATVRATDILDIVRDTGTFPVVTAKREEGQAVVLSKRVLSRLVDRPVGSWVVRRDGSGGSSRYRLEAVPPI